ncbi:MAG TPA: HAMP domain-containing sensor histidine kinase, partial [Anaeromyxobacteraceae bacterium]|nr:HAMP domain-containing sensor histidine kinase [Anaeromyxobacteraceae bacterium]
VEELLRGAAAVVLGGAALAPTRLLAGPLEGLFFSVPLAAFFLSGMIGSVWTAFLTAGTFAVGAAIWIDESVSGAHLAHAVETYRFVGFLAIASVAAWVSGSMGQAYRRSRDARAQAQIATEQAMLAKTGLERVLAIVSHDLRTPLSAIRMTNERLRRSPDLAERHRTALDRIASSAERMTRLISDLADLGSSLRSERLSIAMTPIELEPVCRRVISELEQAHSGRELELDVAGCPIVIGDSHRLMQVVSNLAGNALQHGAPNSAVQVRVGVESDEAVVAVHNDGPTIAPAVVPKLFEPFLRGHSIGRGEQPNSVGLGLFIVRQVVLAHGGRIDVRSEPGEGTTFIVRLPAFSAPGIRGAMEQENGTHGAPDGRGVVALHPPWGSG